MSLTIVEESVAALEMYATIPSVFLVRERLAVHAVEQGLGGLHLVASPVDVPYRKDYDVVRPPVDWPTHIDFATAGVLGAFEDEARAGGVIVVCGAAPGVRPDVARIWDLRVSPAMRGRGIGTALLEAAEAWACARGAAWLQVETQDINVPACRLSARHGCVLGAIHRFAYPPPLDEVQLLWFKRLGR